MADEIARKEAINNARTRVALLVRWGWAERVYTITSRGKWALYRAVKTRVSP